MRRRWRFWGSSSLIALASVAACGDDPTFTLDPAPRGDTLVAMDSVAGLWQTAPALPGPRMGHAALVFGGDLVVAGGITGPGEHTASVIRLRPGADAWDSLAPMPYELTGLALAVVRDTLYAVGGDGPLLLRPERALFAYDAGADTWGERAQIPDWRVGTEAVAVADELWLVGGYVSRTTEHGPIVPGDTILVYEPGADEWRYTGAVPNPRGDFAAVQTPDGRSYLVGGVNGLFPHLRPDADVFDEATGEWRTITDPMGTHRVAAAYAEPFVHVVGGDRYRSFHRALDTRDDSWVVFPQIPYALELSELVFWEDALWLIGGFMTAEDLSRVMLDRVRRLDLSDLGREAPALMSGVPR